MSYETPLNSVSANLSRLAGSITNVARQEFRQSQIEERQDLKEREAIALDTISKRNRALFIELRETLAVETGAAFADTIFEDENSTQQSREKIFGEGGVFDKVESEFERRYTEIPDGDNPLRLAWKEAISSSRINANDRFLQRDIEGARNQLNQKISERHGRSIASAIDFHSASTSAEDSYEYLLGDLRTTEEDFSVVNLQENIARPVEDSEGNVISIVSGPEENERLIERLQAGQVELTFRSFLASGKREEALKLLDKLESSGLDLVDEDYSPGEGQPPQRLGSYIFGLIRDQASSDYSSIGQMVETYDQNIQMIEMEKSRLRDFYDDESRIRKQQLEAAENSLRDERRNAIEKRINFASRVGLIDTERRDREVAFHNWNSMNIMNGIDLSDTPRTRGSGSGSSLQDHFNQIRMSNPDQPSYMTLAQANDRVLRSGGFTPNDMNFLIDMMIETKADTSDPQSRIVVENAFETLSRNVSNPNFFAPGSHRESEIFRTRVQSARNAEQFLQSYIDQYTQEDIGEHLKVRPFVHGQYTGEDGKSIPLATALQLTAWANKTEHDVLNLPQEFVRESSVFLDPPGRANFAAQRMFVDFAQANPSLSDDQLLHRVQQHQLIGTSVGSIVGQKSNQDGRLFEAVVAAHLAESGSVGFENIGEMEPSELAEALQRIEVVPLTTGSDWKDPSQIPYQIFFKKSGQSVWTKDGAPLILDFSEIQEMKENYGIETFEDLTEHYQMGGEDLFLGDVDTQLALSPYDGKRAGDPRFGDMFESALDVSTWVLSGVADAVFEGAYGGPSPGLIKSGTNPTGLESGFGVPFDQSKWNEEGAPNNPLTSTVMGQTGINSYAYYNDPTVGDVIYNPDEEFLLGLRENGQEALADSILNAQATMKAWGAKGYPRSEDERMAHRLTLLMNKLAFTTAVRSENEALEIAPTIQSDAFLADLVEKFPELKEAAEGVRFGDMVDNSTFGGELFGFLGKAMGAAVDIAYNGAVAVDSWQRGVRREVVDEVESHFGMGSVPALPPEYIGGDPNLGTHTPAIRHAWRQFWHPEEDKENVQNGVDVSQLKTEKTEFNFTDEQIKYVNAAMKNGRIISTKSQTREEVENIISSPIPDEFSSVWHFNSGPNRLQLDLAFLQKMSDDVANGKAVDVDIQELGDLQSSRISFVDDGDTFVTFNGESFVLTMKTPEELQHHYGPDVPAGIPIRLAFIDTTEIDRPWLDKKGEMLSEEATVFAIKALNGKNVYLRPMLGEDGSITRGYYGRPIVDIAIEGEENLAEALVRNGLGFVRPSEQGFGHLHAERYRNLLALQQEAEMKRVGLWRLSTPDNTAVHQSLYWEWHNRAISNGSFMVDDSGMPITTELAVYSPNEDANDSYIIPRYNPANGVLYKSAEEAWQQMGAAMAERGQIYPFANAALAKKVMRGIKPRIETYQYKDHAIHQALMSYHVDGTLGDFDERMKGIQEVVSDLDEDEAQFLLDKWKVFNPNRPPRGKSLASFRKRYDF